MSFIKKILFVIFIQQVIPLFSQSQNALLWEVSGNGLKEPSYIFGTYHLMTSTFIDSFPVILRDLKKTKAVAGEMVLDPSLATKVMQGAIMKDSSLTQLLTKEDYKLVADYLKETSGMELSFLDKMKPVFVSTMFYRNMLPKNDKGVAMDLYLQDVGKKQNKKIFGFETVEDQMDILFNSISLKRQAEQLVQTVKGKDKWKVEMKKVDSCYRKQDLTCIGKSMTEASEYSDAEMDVLLVGRNKRWMQKIPQMMLEQSVFIAVGAGHLPSENGLLNLLRKMGYNVNPIDLNKN